MAKRIKNGELSLSPVAIRLLDAAVDIQQNPDATDKAYMARQLVQCTLPHSNPGNEPIWSRTNGNLTLSIQPHIDRKTRKALYPYGTIPRLLLFWMVTEATQTKNRRLRLGHSLAGFMRELGLNPDTGGGKRSDAVRLRDQMTRLLRATISFEQNYVNGHSWLDMQIGPEAVLWWDPDKTLQDDLFESWVELGEKFYQAITAAPVPLDMRALKALKKSPLALDLYSWLAYKTWNAARKGEPQAVNWIGLHAQMGSDYSDINNFKKKVRAILPKIQQVYPQMKVTQNTTGLLIKPAPPAIPPRIR